MMTDGWIAMTTRHVSVWKGVTSPPTDSYKKEALTNTLLKTTP